jgi:hypothetical protein
MNSEKARREETRGDPDLRDPAHCKSLVKPLPEARVGGYTFIASG